MRKRFFVGLTGVVLVWATIAYLLLPFFWRHYEHNPAMETSPKRTVTGNNIPGDPLNVGLEGTEAEIINALLAARWYPADRTTFRTGLRIAASVLLHRQYPTAPVSNLYLWGRKQDLAFEKPSGHSPRKRHHVRFWLSPMKASTGRPLWVGAATYDAGVGLSHRTGQITHHISPDIDAERDTLVADLAAAGQLTHIYQVTGLGPTLYGKNGGGNWFYTDGEMTIGVIAQRNVPLSRPPEELSSPPSIKTKNWLWSGLRRLLRAVF